MEESLKQQRGWLPYGRLLMTFFDHFEVIRAGLPYIHPALEDIYIEATFRHMHFEKDETINTWVKAHKQGHVLINEVEASMEAEEEEGEDEDTSYGHILECLDGLQHAMPQSEIRHRLDQPVYKWVKWVWVGHPQGDLLIRYAFGPSRDSCLSVAWSHYQSSSPSNDQQTRVEDQPAADQRWSRGDKSEKNSSSINDGTSKKRQRRKTSTAWDEFYLLPIDVDGKQKAKCKKCGAEYVANASTHGTENLRRHINSCPLRDNYDVKQMHMDYGTKLHAKKIEQDVYREKMAIAVIKHCYPFSWVEHEGNRDVHKYLNPDVKPITRNTAKADVLKIHKRGKEKLKLTLQSAFGKVCLTSDCWSSPMTEGYLCITAHFVDENWVLHSKIINFSYIPPPHSGVALSEKTFNVLKEWGIDRKIFSITLDNATANDSLKVIERVVYNIRESVKYIKGSKGRKLKFEECIKQVGILSSISLCLDVPTRWNSTFMMIESALTYRRALIHYALLDANYNYCPSNEEWNNAKRSSINIGSVTVSFLAFAIVLDPPYKLQFVEFCYSKIDSSTSRQKLNLLCQKLYSLFQDYANKSKSSLESIAPSTGGTGGSDNLIRDELSHWKDNRFRYPNLYLMARDVLTIPITSVASESAFSVGAQVLNKYRRSLLPENAGALITTRNCGSK
ncbi:zinc finger BED domain-containing protein DAYSLEEPER-like [Malania oleifera]|uniref:zinc finger BED domain-containing protein DAYSLEEPER-like n=1 Tax=Malania oleifera TaxID=397392 RepID=UPI0025ADEC8C|nr:zinc finger BED domain-containing protein DAYSLEEPER-like [Malania oleifera]